MLSERWSLRPSTATAMIFAAWVAATAIATVTIGVPLLMRLDRLRR